MKQCENIKQQTCYVTFDQPLDIRARIIVNDQKYLTNIVVRLGGFHLLMSFLGAVGYIMSGSGLQELWLIIYAQKSTEKMISGHHYSRSLRAHFLTHLALSKLILNEMCISEIEKQKWRIFFLNWEDEISSITGIQERFLNELLKRFGTAVIEIKKRGKTAQLWIQYLEYVSLVREFIFAERSGNWQLHLYCVGRMLPVFHAAGHLNYAKSAHLYLQYMMELEKKNVSWRVSEVYNQRVFYYKKNR